jgi:hypothetical protein
MSIPGHLRIPRLSAFFVATGLVALGALAGFAATDALFDAIGAEPAAFGVPVSF